MIFRIFILIMLQTMTIAMAVWHERLSVNRSVERKAEDKLWVMRVIIWNAVCSAVVLYALATDFKWTP